MKLPKRLEEALQHVLNPFIREANAYAGKTMAREKPHWPRPTWPIQIHIHLHQYDARDNHLPTRWARYGKRLRNAVAPAGRRARWLAWRLWRKPRCLLVGHDIHLDAYDRVPRLDSAMDALLDRYRRGQWTFDGEEAAEQLGLAEPVLVEHCWMCDRHWRTLIHEGDARVVSFWLAWEAGFGKRRRLKHPLGLSLVGVPKLW